MASVWCGEPRILINAFSTLPLIIISILIIIILV